MSGIRSPTTVFALRLAASHPGQRYSRFRQSNNEADHLPLRLLDDRCCSLARFSPHTEGVRPPDGMRF
jgi:hypothetical protein